VQPDYTLHSMQGGGELEEWVCAWVPRVGGVGAAVWVGGPRLGGVGAGGVARMWEWVQQCGCGWKLFLFFPWLFKGGGCITASLCNVKRSNGVECVTDDI